MSDNITEDGCNVDPISILRLYQQEIGILFYIKHASYFVPCKIAKSGIKDRMAYAAFILPTGERFIPAFTNPDELAQWPYERDKAVLLSFDELKFTALNDQYKLSGIIIDPFSKKMYLRRKQIEQIDLVTDGIGIHNVSHSKDMKLTKPEAEIPGLAEELRAFFSGWENVYKAYILMVREPGEAEHLMVVVDFDGQMRDLFPSLAKVICTKLQQGETFEMMKATYNLLNAAASLVEPIYQKY